MSKLKLCIFDMGGVMVDGHDVTPDLADQLGMTVSELLPLLRAARDVDLHDGTAAPEEFWGRFRDLTGFDVPGDPWADLFTPVRRPAMFALVQRLKAAGIRVVAGTNTIDAHYAIHSDQGDYDAFDLVYASNLMHVSKPNQDFWHHILREEGVSAHDALFVDDLPENVAAAAAVGIRAVHYQTLAQAVAAVEQAFGLDPVEV